MGSKPWIGNVGLAALATAAVAVSGVALNQGAAPAGVARSFAAAAPATAVPSATPTISPAQFKLPAEPRLLIVGDSYTAGVGVVRPDQGWASLVANELGYPAKVDGIGGTGFAWGGGTSDEAGKEYFVRLREAAEDASFVPNVLILQGGQNDALLKDDAEVRKAVASTVAEARKLWPAVQILIMGPSAPEPLAANLTGTNAALRGGAATAGVPFIDAAGEHWFTPQNSGSYYADGSHVNTAGHKLIADNFVAHWRELTK